MRWLFAALVLVNLGLLMWASWYKEEWRAPSAPSRPEVNREQLKLLAEPGVRLEPRATRSGAAQALVPASPAACYRLGPFAQREQAARAEARLGELRLAFVQREETRETPKGYRVYLPPFPTREAAEARRAELTRLGFRDHAVIQEEGMQNAVSLGVFAVEANARSHLEKLAAKGIRAELQPILQRRSVYWVELHGEVVHAVLDTLRRESWGAEAGLHETPCPAAPDAADAAKHPVR